MPLDTRIDVEGSIRLPASACGVFGLKPSRGRIPTAEPVLPGDIAVRFTVSRSVRDSAGLLAASERKGSDALLPEVGEVTGPSTRRLKIAFALPGLVEETPHPHVAAALQDTANLCRELGHTVVEAAPAINGRDLSGEIADENRPARRQRPERESRRQPEPFDGIAEATHLAVGFRFRPGRKRPQIGCWITKKVRQRISTMDHSFPYPVTCCLDSPLR